MTKSKLLRKIASQQRRIDKLEIQAIGHDYAVSLLREGMGILPRGTDLRACLLTAREQTFAPSKSARCWNEPERTLEGVKMNDQLYRRQLLFALRDRKQDMDTDYATNLTIRRDRLRLLTTLLWTAGAITLAYLLCQ